MPFIKEGIEEGDSAFHVVDPLLWEDHLQRLQQDGIDVAGAQASGQLDLRGWQDSYLQNGRFDQDRAISLLESVLQSVARSGQRLTRVIVHMDWAAAAPPGGGDLAEYETRLNLSLPRYRDVVVCLYDLNRFSGGIVIDIMRAHPMVIVGGALQPNPFYVPPEELLRELRARHAG